VADIAAKTIHQMERVFGSRPCDVRAAIGPGIGVCCFEVGPEVATLLRTVFPERTDLGQNAHIDLIEANRRQLVAAGVSDLHIDTAHTCTFCHAEELHSHRRDKGNAGRMVSVVGIRT
jgi:copper oxidase (laccase) domain-containing protein